MLKSKTVFIVGAGASCEANLPAGGALKRIIYDKLDFRSDEFKGRESHYGDGGMYEWIRRQFPRNVPGYLTACKRIRDGILLSASIDDFLDVHRDDKDMEVIGKATIARAILEAEKGSLLTYDTGNVYNTMEFSKIENTWYMGFFRLLQEGFSKATRHDIFKKATVISFNYDRCIEHFLVHALAAHYQIKRDEARELAQQLLILRPYGSVGNYLATTTEQVPFGNAETRFLDYITKNIKTYTERVKDHQTLNQIHTAVKEAGVVVFLGNAFHASNMKLITPAAPTPVRKRIFFTRHNVSDPDLAVVQNMLIQLSGNTQKYVPHPNTDYYYTSTCQKLFEEFRLSLRQ